MKEPPTRRGVFALVLIAVIAIVCLLLGHEAIDGYLEKHGMKSRPPTPAPAEASGASGQVTFDDGTPAAWARVGIVWQDSAGRPGTTPAMTDESGRFSQGNLPVNGAVTEVHSTLGPLVAKVSPSDLPRGGTSGGPLKIALPREFRLAGLVRRAGDREPVAGAMLELMGARATTGKDGDFQLEHVPGTALRDRHPVVRITADGYADLAWPLPRDAEPEAYGDLTIVMEAKR